MATHEPPPPRFVMQVKTGKWYRQSRPTQRAVTTAEHMQNSLDYFLRKAMYGSVSLTNSTDEKVPPSLAICEDCDAFDDRVERWRAQSPASRNGIREQNPIFGLLGGVPLYVLYDALVQRKGIAWETLNNSGSLRVPIPLRLDELYEVCTRLVPNMVSREYLERMFRALPDYSISGESVPIFAFFSFMVEHALHPQLDRNVSAIFKAFDPDETGLISAATLTPTVVAAWAELSLFGKLRSEWEKMATVLESNGPVDLRIAGDQMLLTPKTTCAVFCASRTLYDAMNLIDMEGSHLQISA